MNYFFTLFIVKHNLHFLVKIIFTEHKWHKILNKDLF